MELKQEQDIRNYVESWLKQQGIVADREVVCGNGIRADLVTPDMVIEIKKQLNRGAIYQAYGQGVAYQKLLNKPKLLIIGLAPVSELKYQEAQRIAENIRTDTVQVVFIDRDPKWGLVNPSAQSKEALKAASQSLSSKSRAASSVQLPFEKPAASGSAKPTTASAKTDQSVPSKPVDHNPMKDIWVLLLIILLFIWVKAAIWRDEQAENLDSQPIPELRLP